MLATAGSTGGTTGLTEKGDVSAENFPSGVAIGMMGSDEQVEVAWDESPAAARFAAFSALSLARISPSLSLTSSFRFCLPSLPTEDPVAPRRSGGACFGDACDGEAVAVTGDVGGFPGRCGDASCPLSEASRPTRGDSAVGDSSLGEGAMHAAAKGSAVAGLLLPLEVLSGGGTSKSSQRAVISSSSCPSHLRSSFSSFAGFSNRCGACCCSTVITAARPSADHCAGVPPAGDIGGTE